MPQSVQHLIPYLFEKYIESLDKKVANANALRRISKAEDFVLFAEKFFEKVHVTIIVNDGSGVGFGLTNGDNVTIDRPDPSAVSGAIDTSGYVPVTGG